MLPLLVLSLVLCRVVMADDSVDGAAEDDAMVIEAHRNAAGARRALDARLVELGYGRGLDLGRRMIHATLRPWKPRVAVFDAGYVVVRTPTLTPLLVAPREGGGGQATFLVAGRRSRQSMEQRVNDAVLPALSSWQQALAAEGLALRLAHLQAELNEAWAAPESAETRRAALVGLWLNTADTDAGQRVRARVLAFVDDQVQPSADPFTDIEELRANIRRGFSDCFLPRPPPGRPPMPTEARCPP